MLCENVVDPAGKATATTCVPGPAANGSSCLDAAKCIAGGACAGGKCTGGKPALWNGEYGTKAPDRFFDAVLLADGGLLLTGERLDVGKGEMDGWVARVDPTGKLIVDKAVGHPPSDGLREVMAHPGSPGRFIHVGFAAPKTGQAYKKGWVVETDAKGAIKGEYGVDNTGKWGLFDAVARADSPAEVVAAGHIVESGKERAWFVRAGTAAVSANALPGPKGLISTFEDVVRAGKGAWIAAGGHYGKVAGKDYQGWVVQLGEDGKIGWATLFAEGSLHGVAVHKTGVVAVGDTGGGKAMAFALNSKGAVQWKYVHPAKSKHVLRAALGLADGTIAAAGTGTDGGDRNAWLLRLDGSAKLLGKASAGDNDAQEISAIVAASGGYFLVGADDKDSGRDGWIGRLNQAGEATCP